MKLAVIITGSDYRRNVGINKIALTRAELLRVKYNYTIDYYYLDCIEIKFSFLSFFKCDIGHTTTIVDGRRIHLLQKYEYISTNRLYRKFLKTFYKIYKRRFADWEWQQDLGKYIKGFDLISAHFNDAAIIAYGAKIKYGTPYCVTWHGSDIHTIPFKDLNAKEKTIIALENADCNFFVSKSLLKTSDKLTVNARKEVIYNSVDDSFFKYTESQKNTLRQQYNVIDKKVISFVGHLIDIKNAALLPEIFKTIMQLCSDDIEFWIVGEGYLRDAIQKQIEKDKIKCKFWGFVTPRDIPDILNCTDVLILPSKNEGLPLVTMEALRCGANVVASNVGGISEVIGVENVVDIDDGFIGNFSKKVVSMLEHPVKQICPKEFDWYKIVEHEYNVYSSL